MPFLSKQKSGRAQQNFRPKNTGISNIHDENSLQTHAISFLKDRIQNYAQKMNEFDRNLFLGKILTGNFGCSLALKNNSTIKTFVGNNQQIGRI